MTDGLIFLFQELHRFLDEWVHVSVVVDERYCLAVLGEYLLDGP